MDVKICIAPLELSRLELRDVVYYDPPWHAEPEDYPF
jgi:hypothetical protein